MAGKLMNGGRTGRGRNNIKGGQRFSNDKTIGATKLSLSERFSQMQSRTTRRNTTTETSKANRQANVARRRPGMKVTPVKKGLSTMKAKDKRQKVNGVRNRSQQARGGRGGRGGRGVRGGRGGRGGRGRGRGGEKKPTADSLDVDMDAYWHAAGKGPDPKQAQLDRQMEDYWASKPKEDDTSMPEQA